MASEGNAHGENDTLLRTRAAVLLTTFIAVLSILTGLVNIAFLAPVGGPLEAYVPVEAQEAAGFTGTLTGFLMLVGSHAMRRGYRVGWYLTIVLLPVTGAQGLIQSNVVSMPLVVLSLVAIPMVLANRGVFDRPLQLTTTQWAALGAIVVVQLYGTLGTFALRDQFAEVDTVTDAFYYTLVTASTVGYGDIVPLTEGARLFSMSVLLTGVASFGVALGTLLGPLIEARLAEALGNMTDKQLDVLDDHYVVVGHGDLTEPILEHLGGAASVVVVRDPDDARYLRDRDYKVLTGDPSDETPLRQVHIERALALIVATNDDAQDAMTVLTARELNPELRIVAAATDRENTKKLRRAGADVVMSPAVLGGRLLVESAFGDDEPERLIEELLEVER